MLSILLALINYSPFQNYLAQRARIYLSEKLNTTVTLQHVRIDLLNRAHLQGLYIEDQQGDTLLYAGEALVRTSDWFMISRARPIIKMVSLRDAYVHMNRKRNSATWNFQFIIDAFTPKSKKPKKEKQAFELDLKKLQLERVKFNVDDEWVGSDMNYYVGQLSLNAQKVDFAERIITLNNLSLSGVRVVMREYKGGRPPKPKSLAPKPIDTTAFNKQNWVITAGHLKVRNSFFSLDANHKIPKPNYFDPAHIHVNNLNLDAYQIAINKDTLTAKVEKLIGMDRSGLTIKNFTADISISPNASLAKNLILKTNESELRDFYGMYYDRFPDFKDYIHKVKMVGHFTNSHLNMNDLAYFSPHLHQYAGRYLLNGNVSGTVDHLIGTELNVSNGITTIKGNMSVRGLPDINTTFFDFTNGFVATNGNELLRYIPELKANKTVAFSKLSAIRFAGDFHGYINDFIANGTLHTNLGSIVSDIKMALPGNAISSYKGKVTALNLEAGKLFGVENIGKVTGTAFVSGKGFNPNSAAININANLNSFEYNGYNYHNIIAQGVLAKNQFTGEMTIADPSITGSFNGFADFRESKMILQANSSLSYLHLKDLGISKDTIIAKGDFELNFTGRHIDDFLGAAQLRNITLLRDGDTAHFDSLIIRSYIEEDGKKTIALSSDIAAGFITGNFQLTNLIASGQYYLYKYLPSYVRKPSAYAPEQDIKFQIVTRHPDRFFRMIYPSVRGFDGSTIIGTFNTNTRDLSVTASVPSGKLGNFHLHNTSVSGFGDFEYLTLLGDFENFRIGDTILNTSLKVNTTLGNDSMNFDITTVSPEKFGTANLKGQALARGNRLLISFFPSEIFLNNTAWQIPGGNNIVFRSDYLEVNNFYLRAQDQEIAVFTNNNNETSHLNIVSKNLDISLFSGLFNLNEIYKPKGKLDAKLLVEDVMRQPVLHAQLIGTQLQLGNEELGKLTLNGEYDFGEKWLRINKGSGFDWQGHRVSGWANMSTSAAANKKIEGEIIFEKTPLAWGTSFMAGLVSHVKGYTNGIIRLGGTSAKPDFRGLLQLDSVEAHINYTGTIYRIPSTQVNVSETRFALTPTQVLDRFDNTASLTGSITHNFFQNLILNIQLRSPNFEVVDLEKSENPLFYGHAICNAQFSIAGPPDNLNMTIRATPTEASHIYLPIQYSDGSSSKSRFVTFKQKDTTLYSYQAVSENKLSINLSATANPLLMVSLIIDPIAGDQINARGTGNIALEIPSGNDLRMYGTYLIDEGDYTFTFQQLGFRRTFDIQSGSKINFYGPFSSTSLDVNATKEERVQLYDLLSDQEKITAQATEGNQSADRITQRLFVKLEMTGSLDNPQYAYQLELPDNRSIGTLGYSKFLRLNQDKGELLEQVAALLILGTFMPSQGSLFRSVSSTAANNVANIFSSSASTQLTNFLARMLNDDDIAVDLKYKNYNVSETGNVSGLNRNEIKLGLRKNYFNDRLLVELGSSYDWGRPTAAPTSSNNFKIAGDFRAQYLITPDGRIRLSAFSISNYDVLIDQNITRAGVGISYRKSFNTLAELFGKSKPVILPKAQPLLPPTKDSTLRMDSVVQRYQQFIGPISYRP